MHNFLFFAAFYYNKSLFTNYRTGKTLKIGLFSKNKNWSFDNSYYTFVGHSVHALAFVNRLETFFIEEKLEKFQEIMFYVLS